MVLQLLVEFDSIGLHQIVHQSYFHGVDHEYSTSVEQTYLLLKYHDVAVGGIECYLGNSNDHVDYQQN